jgi:hypothetical protein
MLDGYDDDGWSRVATIHNITLIAFIGANKLAFNFASCDLHSSNDLWKICQTFSSALVIENIKETTTTTTTHEHNLSRTKVEIYDGINFHRVEIKAFNGYVSFLFAPLLPIVVGCSVCCCCTYKLSFLTF